MRDTNPHESKARGQPLSRALPPFDRAPGIDTKAYNSHSQADLTVQVYGYTRECSPSQNAYCAFPSAPSAGVGTAPQQHKSCALVLFAGRRAHLTSSEGVMAHVLVSMVGARSNIANYRFPDRSVRTGSLFGPLLLDFLGSPDYLTKLKQRLDTPRVQYTGRQPLPGPPDRVVFIGTKGSRFDLVAHGFEVKNASLIQVLERVAGHNVNDENDGMQALSDLAHTIGNKIQKTIEFELVPDGRETSEQLATLRALAKALALDDDAVTLDVTHSLRHLPMLALLAVLYLRGLRPNLRVLGVWYAAFDLKFLDELGKELTPVVDLEYLISFGDWISAFGVFDHTRDFGTFADLLKREGVPADIAERLKRASEMERITRLRESGNLIDQFRKEVGKNWPNLAEFFRNDLEKRLELVTHGTERERDGRLALLHLERGDALRAVVLAIEAANQCYGGKDRGEPYPRELPSRQRDSYDDLRLTRNAIVHVDEPDASHDRSRRVREWLAQPRRLQRDLPAIIKALLGLSLGIG